MRVLKFRFEKIVRKKTVFIAFPDYDTISS